MLKIWQRRRERAREILLLNQYNPRVEVEYQYSFILTEENRNILSTVIYYFKARFKSII